MMPDLETVIAIMAIGAASIAMRLIGYLAAGAVPTTHAAARIIRLAPGNLSVAFVALGCLQGGWPGLTGSGVALASAVVSKRQWVALALGFAAAALVAALR
jgi:hypothetical protein